MINKLLVTIAIFCSIALYLPAEQENYLHHAFDARLIVADPDKAARDLAAWCEAAGGYVVLKSTEQVVLRFPYSQNGKLPPFLESISEEVIGFSPAAVDLREEMLGLTSAIQSREEILTRNLEFIDRTSVEGTLSIEREVMQLLTEIESLKGKLSRINTDRRYARAVLNLAYLEQKLPQTIPSSFPWLNGVDFYRFISEAIFRVRPSLFGINAAAPEGFALFKGGRGSAFVASSPEGVLYSINRIKNYPKMGLEFWIKALEKHLVDGGYSLYGRAAEFETAKKEKGMYLEWLVPYQGRDYVYMTGLVIRRGRILIVEAGGEYGLFKGYRDKITESLTRIK